MWLILIVWVRRSVDLFPVTQRTNALTSRYDDDHDVLTSAQFP